MNAEASQSSFARYQWIVVLVAAAIFIGCAVSPPVLMDDVDSVQANIARTMLTSGDWVTPHLDGIKYFEKPPLKYWMIASSFKVFGVHDWAARLPLVLIDVLLCWLVFRMGVWSFGNRAGFYAGLILASSIGLFLFTRILISDSQITCAITLALWAFLRALDSEERRPRLWGLAFWASSAVSVMLKGLIGAVFPFGAAFLFLVFTGLWRERETYRRLAPASGMAVFLAIAAPWHVLATLRNPPYLRFEMYSGPGDYRGFFWFYFFNEHILRFLNLRYPRDYSTVPRLWFWLLNLLWLFPGSLYLPVVSRLSYRAADRAARMRLLALCTIGFVMVFFTFSSTQEYYSMPIYPWVALLVGSGLVAAESRNSRWLKAGDALVGIVCALALGAMIFMLAHVWNTPTPGDISQALQSQDTNSYSLSLGRMGDLTLHSFAYLRTPLVAAALAMLIGLGSVFLARRYRIPGLALMMVLFFHAARLALVVFDPYLSSQELAASLVKSPPGKLIISDQYYQFSSVLFYADRDALLLNGRVNNVEYGSNAPGAPNVFIDDAALARMWASKERYYLVAWRDFLPNVVRVIGEKNFAVVKESGGKYLITNLPVAGSGKVYSD